MKGARSRSAFSILGLGLILNFHACGDALDSWTNTSPFTRGDTGYDRVIFANGKFIATLSAQPISPLPSPDGAICTSIDGVNWVYTNFPMSITGVAYGNGIYVAAGWNPSNRGTNGAMYYSANGTDWFLASQSPAPPGLNGLAFGNGVFVAVGFSFQSGMGYIDVSTNGVDWTAYYPAGTNYFNSIAFGNGAFVLPEYPYPPPSISDVIISTNGVDWQDTSNALPAYLSKIRYVKDRFYAVTQTNEYWSVDGNVWNLMTGPIPSLWIPLSGTSALYLSGGLNAIYTSPNALSWTARPTRQMGYVFDIAYGNNRVVGVAGPQAEPGGWGTILTSGYTIPSISASNQLPAGVRITISGGLGPTYQLQATTDFITWSNLVTFTSIGASTQYLDSAAVNFQQRYYRTVSP